MLLKMASPSLVHLNVFKLKKLNFTVVYLGHAFLWKILYRAYGILSHAHDILFRTNISVISIGMY